MLKNLASSLFLSERDDDLDETGRTYSAYVDSNQPKVKGRVITTLQKAKTVRPLVEKCVTIARKSLVAIQAAEQYATTAERGSDEWKTWRTGEQWQQWNQAMAPAVNGRRRCIQLLGNKYAVEVLFDSIAARFARAVNRVFGRRGRVLDGRFHSVLLHTPTQVRNAIRYVLLNARKHGSKLRGIDPASSGRCFDGWRGVSSPGDAHGGALEVARPRSWLLRVGWRRRGLIDLREQPGAPRA